MKKELILQMIDMIEQLRAMAEECMEGESAAADAPAVGGEEGEDPVAVAMRAYDEG
jgi:hypothetical protein